MSGIHTIVLPLVMSLMVNGRGVAGVTPPSYNGSWYRWTYSEGYEPGRAMMHPLYNPASSKPAWDVAGEAAISAIGENVQNDPEVQNPNGQGRIWLLLNEPDLPEEPAGGWYWDADIAAYWYSRAYIEIKANDPYGKTTVAGPNLFDTQDLSPWAREFITSVQVHGGAFDAWAIHDWWGRFDTPDTYAPLTYAGLQRHIDGVRAMGVTAPIWVTETGVLWWGTDSEAWETLDAIRAWGGHDQIARWYWFEPGVGDHGGRLWTDAGSLTPVGRAWFTQAW